jgi:hypothetical protein
LATRRRRVVVVVWESMIEDWERCLFKLGKQKKKGELDYSVTGYLSTTGLFIQQKTRLSFL